MLESKGDYYPINKINNNRVRFNIPLPAYIRPDEIGVNVKGLLTLLRIGGISHLRVIGRTDEETSRSTPSILGYDSHGNAYAGKQVEKVDVPEYLVSDEEADHGGGSYIFRPHSATWKNMTLNININEMAEKIKDEEVWSRGVYSTEAWADHLDRNLRAGVTEVGVRHLALGFGKLDTFIAGFQYGVMSLYESQTKSPSLQGLLTSFCIIALFNNVLDYRRYGNSENGFRWSVFYGPQLDRALILKVLSGRTNLVKAEKVIG